MDPAVFQGFKFSRDGVRCSFAAIRQDGKVVTWGDPSSGGVAAVWCEISSSMCRRSREQRIASQPSDPMEDRHWIGDKGR